jgi:hypothetical protein
LAALSIFTEDDSLDELKTMIRDAVSCHFDAAEKSGVIRARPTKAKSQGAACLPQAWDTESLRTRSKGNANQSGI